MNHEVITACENICRDFAWLGPFSEWVRNFALTIGVFVAWYQVGAWRREKRQLRRAEVAEEAISEAFAVWDSLKAIRSPFDSVPKYELDNPRYTYARRYERIVEANEPFAKLRQSQIRVRAVIGDVEVDAAIETLFGTRSKVGAALQVLADYADEPPEDPESRKHRVDLRRTAYGIGGEADKLGMEIEDAVARIERRLAPIARLEST